MLDELIDDHITEMMKAPISKKECTMLGGHLEYYHDRTQWIPVPCNRTYSHVAIVCKARKEKTQVSLTKSITIRKKTFTCPNGYVYIADFKSCFILLTSDGFINNSISCLEAIAMCTSNKSHIANSLRIHENMEQVLNYYLLIWKHEKEYGGVWLNNCDALVVNTNTEALDTLIPFIWTDQVKKNTLMLNVLCQTDAIQVKESCSNNLYKCADGTCILEHNVCDGKQDCSTGDDESVCTCTDNHFFCDNGICMSPSKYCDNIIDCKDESDEKNCSKINDLMERNIKTKKSLDIDILEHLALNSVITEEIFNFTANILDPRGTWFSEGFKKKTNNQPFCSNSSFVRCYKHSNHCFNRAEACIYDTDSEGQMKSCVDGEHITNCTSYQCPSLYKCKDAYCVPFHKVCNGVFDCPDGSEEENCRNLSCPGLFKCKVDNICIEQQLRCDGIVHCKMSMEDERFCVHDCPSECQCKNRIVNCSNLMFNTMPIAPTETSLLDVSFNKITLSNANILIYPLMMKLVLKNNNISLIPLEIFRNLSLLLTLDLRFNFLKILSKDMFRGLSRLQHLYLEGNSIVTIDKEAFHGLHTIVYLNLENLGIENIDDNAFWSLSSVLALSLRNNSLRLLSQKSLHGLNQLDFLDLSLNMLESIDPQALRHVKVNELHTDEFRFCCFAVNASVCFPPADMFSSCDDLIANEVLQIAIWVLGGMAVVGNLITIIWRVFRMQNQVQGVLIINLAISDFVMGLYLITVGAADLFYRNSYARHDYIWRNSIFCKVAGMVSTISSEMSTYVLCIVSSERPSATVRPLSHVSLTIRQSFLLCFLGWLTAGVLGLIPLIETNYFKDDLIKHGICLFFNISVGKYSGWEYMMVLLLLNSTCCIYMLVAYAVIFLKCMRYQKDSGRSPGSTNAALRQKMIQLVLVNAFCWLPIVMVAFISLSGFPMRPEVSVWMVVFVLPLNSALNPYLYSLSNTKYIC